MRMIFLFAVFSCVILHKISIQNGDNGDDLSDSSGSERDSDDNEIPDKSNEGKELVRHYCSI